MEGDKLQTTITFFLKRREKFNLRCSQYTGHYGRHSSGLLAHKTAQARHNNNTTGQCGSFWSQLPLQVHSHDVSGTNAKTKFIVEFFFYFVSENAIENYGKVVSLSVNDKTIPKASVTPEKNVNKNAFQ